jgi:hypothetical protein
MTVDWNRVTLEKKTVFHFKNSLRPFVEVGANDGNYYFLDLNEMRIYSFEELEDEGLKFYEDETDCDYMGVKTDGKIEWVS